MQNTNCACRFSNRPASFLCSANIALTRQIIASSCVRSHLPWSSTFPVGKLLVIVVSFAVLFLTFFSHYLIDVLVSCSKACTTQIILKMQAPVMVLSKTPLFFEHFKLFFSSLTLFSSIKMSTPRERLVKQLNSVIFKLPKLWQISFAQLLDHVPC
jgi:hypothetical protein